MTFDEVIAQSIEPETLRSVFAAYLKARGENDVASQDRLPMREMAPLLPNITLMECIDEGTILYRIMGERIVERLGFNPTGQNFYDFLDPSQRAESIYTTKAGLAAPCGHYSIYQSRFESGRSLVSESLLLPMRKTASAEIDFIFGYHVHHQATNSFSLGGRTQLGTSWDVSEFIDIGLGLPDSTALAAISASVDTLGQAQC